MTGAAGPHEVVPALKADDLLASLPGLPPGVEVRAETLCTKPGASLEFADLANALRWGRLMVAEGAAGVVLAKARTPWRRRATCWISTGTVPSRWS
jgi:hypothetical protein